MRYKRLILENTIMHDAAHTLELAAVRAGELELQARKIRQAAKTIAYICNKKRPSESRDCEAWDRATQILEDAGLPVPNSAYMAWTD